jgi:DNA-binding beta-propeller fold protein YncE
MVDAFPEVHRLSRFIFSRELNNDIFPFLMARSYLVILTIFPNTLYLIAVDLGLDALMAHPIDPVNAINDAAVVTTGTEAGFGLRHVIFEPDGAIPYVANELANSVTSYAFADVRFTPIRTVTSIPSYDRGFSKVAAIRFSPDRKAILASNRGYDSVAIYAIDHRGGVELKNIVSSIGQAPRDIAFILQSNLFVAANVQTNNASLFQYVPDTYNLVPLGGKTIALPQRCASGRKSRLLCLKREGIKCWHEKLVHFEKVDNVTHLLAGRLFGSPLNAIYGTKSRINIPNLTKSV